MTSTSRKTNGKFDALFDYSKIQPPIISLDDDDDDDLQVVSPPPPQPCTPGRSITDSEVGKENRVDGAAAAKVVDDNDWLETPISKPKCHQALSADPTLLNLRKQKQELENILRVSAIEEASMQEARVTEAASPHSGVCGTHDRSEEAPNKRQKILLKLQGESGEPTGVRICVDEKLEKLFSHYAKNVGKRPLTDYVFRFDGQQLDANKSPKDFDLEDEDIVEVHVKKARK